MIPEFIEVFGSPWDLLPLGLHHSTLSDVENRYVYNQDRKRLFDGLIEASKNLRLAGCRCIYLNGSFVTAKPHPNDFDACWDPTGVDMQLIDPVFNDFNNLRAAQKNRFGGEFFPSNNFANEIGQSFLEFFQTDRFSGKPKGIIVLRLINDPQLNPVRNDL